MKKLKLSQRKLIVFRAPPSLISRLESIEGLETKAFNAKSPAAALAAVEESKLEDEGAALLNGDGNV